MIGECGLQINTLENINTVLHPTFQLAVRDDIIRKNPTDGAYAEIKNRHGGKKILFFMYGIRSSCYCLEQGAELGKLLDFDGMTNFIFTNRFGNPHNPAAVNRAIKRIVDTHNAEEEIKAKKEKRSPIMIPRFSCHIFRHTFASGFCENETNIKIIQTVMGHADVSTTMNIYAEANESVTKESIENLAKNLDVF